MINKIGNFNIKDLKQKGIQQAGSEDNESGIKSFKQEKSDFETSESLKETIGMLKHSIGQNRNDDRVQYDMSNLQNQDDSDLKFL